MKYALLAVSIFLIPFSFSHAQINQALISQELTIDTEPANPSPLSDVRASINDYSLPVTVSGVSWRLNGKTLTAADNLRSVNFKTDDLSTKTILQATVTLTSGGTVTATKTIYPTYLDIIIEPLTRTPAFYQGRALPSVGSKVNLTALVSGLAASPTNLIYTWRINNTVIEGGSLRGKNKITATTPMGEKFLISVDVSNTSGELLTRRTIEVPSVSPEVSFYEVTSLQGMKSKSINNGFSLISESSTIQAEPYYLDLDTYNNPEFLEWKIGGQKSDVLSTNPYQVTLARLGAGSTKVGFQVRDLSQLLQGARGDFQVNF